MKRLTRLIILCCSIIFAGCERRFEPIDFGKEACAHCRMTILDQQFAAELIDRKGKVYKFDDVACMKKFIRERQLPETDLLLFVSDYRKPGNEYLEARKAYFARSEAFASPMNGNCAAFPDADAARNNEWDKAAKIVDWSAL